MSDTSRTIPKAAEFAERINNIYAQISWESLNQSQLIFMADARCQADADTPEDVGALVYSLAATKNNVFELVRHNLRDTVNLLLERVKELESENV